MFNPFKKKLDRDKVKKCLNIAAEITGLLVLIKEKPRLLDLFAISTKVLDISARIHSELAIKKMLSPWDYFRPQQEDSLWVIVPNYFDQWILPSLEEQTPLLGFTEADNPKAFLGMFNGHEIGMINGKDKIECFFFKKHEKDLIFNKMNSNFWKNSISKHLLLEKGELVNDDHFAGNIVETNFIKDIEAYLTGVLNAGEHGSCLLVGEPGTGKTLAIQHVIKKLGLKSVRMPLKTLMRAGYWEKCFDFETAINVTMPDILIIDDIDRLDHGVQKQLLEFIDTSKDKIKFFIASANNLEEMISPLKRPGRFDEHMDVPPLDEDILEKLMEEKGLRKDMKNWPICYLEYYKKYRRIFGQEAAEKIIPKLKERIKVNNK